MHALENFKRVGVDVRTGVRVTEVRSAAPHTHAQRFDTNMQGFGRLVSPGGQFFAARYTTLAVQRGQSISPACW
jgi:hypothetical protein